MQVSFFSGTVYTNACNVNNYSFTMILLYIYMYIVYRMLSSKGPHFWCNSNDGSGSTLVLLNITDAVVNLHN